MADKAIESFSAQEGIRYQVKRQGRLADQTARIIFFICAVLVIVIIFGVFIFVGINGFRVFAADSHAINFLSSTVWDPTGANGTPSFGALGFILGSVVLTVVSIIIATPLAFGMALFMAELTPRWLAAILRPLLEVFTGVPSVVIGFLGLVVLVPWIAQIAAPIAPLKATAGFGWGAGIIVLVIMILPTVISISIDALRAVPNSVREASLALGSTRWQMMKNAVIPAASSGLATAVVLGMTRAIGESLAVNMVLQGSVDLPKNLFTPAVFFQPNINITNTILIYFEESFGAERDAYFLLGFVLLIISFLFICVSRYLASRSVYK